MAEVKEIQEIEVFIISLTCLIIKEIRQHQGKPADIVKDIMLGIVSEKIRNEGVAAFSGLTNIPEEVKNAGVDGWINFAITSLMSAIPAIISAVTDPVESL